MQALNSSEYLLRLQGLVQTAGVAVSVLHARYALFEVLQRVMGGRPTEAVLLGCLLLGGTRPPGSLIVWGCTGMLRRSVSFNGHVDLVYMTVTAYAHLCGASSCAFLIKPSLRKCTLRLAIHLLGICFQQI